MGIGVMEILVIIMIINILTLPFWIFAIIDVLRSNFEGNDKVVWLLTVILLFTIGVILYFFVGRKKKLKKEGQ
jgi:hypothetical protein